ncbi:protease inhibitor I42 family protein [Nocardia amamiensis]|uniref:Protease inhibitor I42 family protein n=1 Tax=Nocardia amamiensis TaxID=404578 RepID=A0ABS0CJU5_9NOCA|nr:protease inhibitor I42 family protein [Nocardia amamiensis]MBF6296875.1 protease inhibitor I42 family protein [Nocardia amamiensis]
MRKSPLVLLLGLAVAGCGGNDVSDATHSDFANPVVRVVETDNGQERRLRVGQRLVVALPSNPSTGYSWSIADLDASVAKQDGAADFEPDPAVPVAPGAGGTSVWSFVGAAAGVTSLRMEYMRPWEHGSAPAATFTLTLEVE